MKKSGIRCLICAVFLLIFTLSAHAESAEETANRQYADFCASVPSEVADCLPEGFFADDLSAFGASLSEETALGTVLDAVGRLTGLSLSARLSLLARVCGVLLLSAVLRAFALSDAGGTKSAFSRAVSLAATLALAAAIVGDLRALFAELSAYFEAMRVLAAALLPLMGTLLLMGGNVGAAAANHTAITAFLAVIETFCASTVLPMAGICLALALADAATGELSLRPLAAFLKRTYAWCLSLLMLLLCGVLGMQSTLAKGSDTLALRTVRFAAGSFLPVVGGSVSEALRTVAGSVGYLRGAVGTGAVAVLFFVFLPPFLSMLTARLTFSLSASLAGLLGCGGEEKLLAELASVFGYFLAVIASLFVATVFALTLFAHCASAV